MELESCFSWGIYSYALIIVTITSSFPGYKSLEVTANFIAFLISLLVLLDSQPPFICCGGISFCRNLGSDKDPPFILWFLLGMLRDQLKNSSKVVWIITV